MRLPRAAQNVVQRLRENAVQASRKVQREAIVKRRERLVKGDTDVSVSTEPDWKDPWQERGRRIIPGRIESDLSGWTGQFGFHPAPQNPRKDLPMHVLENHWLPIVISAVVVFLLSWIIHVLLPWHKSDLKKLPNEGPILDALRPFNIPPGDYMAPACESMADMKTAAHQEKLNRGPIFMATFRPAGCPRIGRSLAFWFIYCLIVTYFAAYVGAHALSHPVGVHPHDRRLIALTAFLGYSAALWQSSIWFGRSIAANLRATIDGLLYAAVTAAIFGYFG
jgi:hypothetical protein